MIPEQLRWSLRAMVGIPFQRQKLYQIYRHDLDLKPNLWKAVRMSPPRMTLNACLDVIVDHFEECQGYFEFLVTGPSVRRYQSFEGEGLRYQSNGGESRAGRFQRKLPALRGCHSRDRSGSEWICSCPKVWSPTKHDHSDR